MDWFYTQFGFSLVLMIVVLAALVTLAGYSTLAERKVCAWLQERIGPNRAGPRGLLQPLADGVKFLLKEDFVPGGANRGVFIIAPGIAFCLALVGFAVVPWGGQYHPEHLDAPLNMQVAGLDVGLLYILAVGGLSVYGVVLGGWASNNKYSFYGGLRAAAQMLSYEVPLGLAILVVVLTSGELRLENIVAAQTESWFGVVPMWNVFLHPVAFVVLFTAVLAETNRAPFDLAECEQELVGGFHTEYSSMKFALFFLGEYAHIITASAFLTVLFFGGWHLPGIDAVQQSIWGVLLQMGVMLAKIIVSIFAFMWIRWTLPRFRFDQLMRLAWKGLVPLTMCLAGVTCYLVYINKHTTFWAPLGDLAVVVGFGIYYLFKPSRITGRQEHLGPTEEKTPGEVMTITS